MKAIRPMSTKPTRASMSGNLIQLLNALSSYELYSSQCWCLCVCVRGNKFITAWRSTLHIGQKVFVFLFFFLEGR